jgi:hypothetical protein
MRIVLANPSVESGEAGMLEQLRRAADASVLETHPHYRTAIGVLGVTLPPILIVVSLLRNQGVENSISAYYHTPMRDWFVGTLWVIGVFLFFYRYRPRRPAAARSDWEPVRLGVADARLGKMSGLCAVLVALLPTTPPPGSSAQPPTIGMLHGIAAATLFLCLALFPLLLFSQSRKRGHVYRRYGWAMVVLLLLVVAYAFGPESVRQATAPWRPVLVLETLLIVVFGVSWFDKGRELAAAGDDEPAATEAGH